MVDDARWMRRALTHARCALGRTAPNPAVGACVVTDEGVVVGDGAHQRAGEPHAEVFALEEAGALARGATLYCTLEPCVHTGRTGPCTERVMAAGIRRVVAAMEDPNPLVQGRGFAALRAHGIEVQIGVEHDCAVRLNQPYLTALRKRRPFVILKAATSLDGCVAAAPGVRTILTSAPADRHAHDGRAHIDAIAVGSGTVLADDPVLTARLVYRERPLARVIFDRTLRTPPGARVFSTLPAGPVIIVTRPESVHGGRARALEGAGATLLALDHGTITGPLCALAEMGIQSLVLEGGPTVHQAAWNAGVVDYIQVYVTPLALGRQGLVMAHGPASAMSSLVERNVRMLGPDVLIEGYVHGPH